MAAHISRLKLKQIPIDMWSTRERLCLASSVLRSGDQNWVSVSRAIKAFGEPDRPPDWFSQKNCALQYADLLEKVEMPKRKRGEKGEIDTPGECIVRKLVAERIEELKKLIQEEQQHQRKLMNEIELVKSGQLDDKLQEMWDEMQQKKKEKEKEALEHKKWLQEREVQKQAAAALGKTKLPKTPSSLVRRNSTQSEQGSETEETAAEFPSVSTPAAETPVKEVSDVQQEPTPTETSVNVPTTPKTSPVASSAPSTSPLLTSLLKSPTHVGPPPAFSSILHSAIAQSKEEVAGHSHTSAAATSTIASLLSSSPAKAYPRSTSESDSKPSFSGAPTLSRLLEMPLASPGKPLPPLPIVSDKPEQAEVTVVEENLQPPPKPEPETVASDETIPSPAVIAEEEPQQSQETDIVESIPEPEVKTEEKVETIENDVEAVQLLDEMLLKVEAMVAVKEEPVTEPEPAVELEAETVVEPVDEPAEEETPVKTEPEITPQTDSEESSEVKEETMSADDIKKEPESEEVSSDSSKEVAEAPPQEMSEKEDVVEVQEEATTVSEEATAVTEPDASVVEETIEEEEKTNVAEKKPEPEVKQEEPETPQASLTRKSIDTVRETRGKRGRPERAVSGKSEDKRERKDSEHSDKSGSVDAEAKTKSIKKEKMDAKKERTRSKTEEKAQPKETPTRSRREESRESRKRKRSVDDAALGEQPAAKSETPVREVPKTAKRIREKESTSASEVDEDSKQSEKEENALSRHSLPSDSIPNSPAQSEDQESLRDYKVWKKAIMLVWRSAANHKFANVFLHPVTEEVAPGYHSVVCRPMDLSQIKKNVENGVIKTTAEFQRDMMLMFQNAIMYNSSDHDVFHMAVEMQKEVMRHIQDFLATQLMVQTAEIPKTLRRETRELTQKRSESQSDRGEEGNRRTHADHEVAKPKKRRSRASDE